MKRRIFDSNCLFLDTTEHKYHFSNNSGYVLTLGDLTFSAIQAALSELHFCNILIMTDLYLVTFSVRCSLLLESNWYFDLITECDYFLQRCSWTALAVCTE